MHGLAGGREKRIWGSTVEENRGRGRDGIADIKIDTTEGMANLRSGAFFAGLGMITTLFVKAGNVLEKSANLL